MWTRISLCGIRTEKTPVWSSCPVWTRISLCGTTKKTRVEQLSCVDENKPVWPNREDSRVEQLSCVD